jgi:hypothetical protein
MWEAVSHSLASMAEGCCYLNQEEKMLWTLVAILVVLWLVGMVSSYTMGGLIHILLVVAVVVVLVRVIQGRKVL